MKYSNYTYTYGGGKCILIPVQVWQIVCILRKIHYVLAFNLHNFGRISPSAFNMNSKWNIFFPWWEIAMRQANTIEIIIIYHKKEHKQMTFVRIPFQSHLFTFSALRLGCDSGYLYRRQLLCITMHQKDERKSQCFFELWGPNLENALEFKYLAFEYIKYALNKMKHVNDYYYYYYQMVFELLQLTFHHIQFLLNHKENTKRKATQRRYKNYILFNI